MMQISIVVLSIKFKLEHTVFLECFLVFSLINNRSINLNHTLMVLLLTGIGSGKCGITCQVIII